MSPFHNPYHFVPVKKRDESTTANDHEVDAAKDGQWGHHGHDRYAEESYSGRLHCRLTTETPIFIGGEQIAESEPKQVRHFEIEGEPAIPGSSLRGLLSSIAESANNSSLRVLHRDRLLSYRYEMKHNLSALGMVVLETDQEGNDQYFLKPLTLPSLDRQNNGAYGYPQRFSEKQCNYAPIFRHFTTPPLKVFISRGNKTTFTLQRPQFYYLILDKLTFNQDKTAVQGQNGLRFSSRDTNARTAIGQKGEMEPKTEIDWLNLPEEEQSKYTRGIVRVMKSPERSDIPAGKKHELFIPFPTDFEKNIGPTFPISTDAIKRFNMLVDERADASEMRHPYEPIGTRLDRRGESLRLQPGDIVYFVPNADGTKVEEVSFSSIWRGYAGTIEEYFCKVDPELLPFNGARKTITPAELLFGFVQDEKSPSSLAFKGKVRISCGRLVHGQENLYEPNEVTLKILSSPKPPSPALYFKPANKPEGGYISKSGMCDPNNNAIPQGRKMYLHHLIAEGKQPWKTADPENNKNQKNQIKPLCKDLMFDFHIDFDNLTKWELGLLCYAVRPMPDYRHKIGMGKPLGLGTVRIDPIENIEIVDRKTRYSMKGFEAERFSTDYLSFCDMRKIFTTGKDGDKRICNGIDGDIKNALRLLGTPSKKFITAPVHTPQVTGIDLETDTYKWFVANDDKNLPPDNREFLVPIDKNTTTLNPLDTPSSSDVGRGQRPQHSNQRTGNNNLGRGPHGNSRR